MRHISKPRLDALADGVFAMSMTLLVLDVQLPANITIATSAQLVDALRATMPKISPYALSFLVLGLCWLSMARAREASEIVSRRHAVINLVYLFLITFMPFSTIVVGRYGNLGAGIWLYAGNMFCIGLASLGLALTTAPATPEGAEARRGQIVGASLFMASAVAAIVWSLFDPNTAPWALLLNVASPSLARRRAGRNRARGA